MANQKSVEEKILKMPRLNFGKGQGMFPGRNAQGKTPGAKFIPPQIRITQSKGAGSGK